VDLAGLEASRRTTVTSLCSDSAERLFSEEERSSVWISTRGGTSIKGALRALV
jgi:hypothetical protein